GAAIIAGISPPKLGPADASRFVEIRLSPLSGAIVSKRQLEEAKARAKAFSPALLGRALKGAWRYRDDVDRITEAMVKAGESPRSADLVAMLIAGRRLLLSDDPLSLEDALEEVRLWRPLLEERASAEAVRNVGSDALAHLLAADAGVHRQDRRETVGRLIHRWVTGDGGYHDALLVLGLRMMRETAPDGREGPWLLVANQHPKLEAIFKGTRFQDWRRSLSMLDTLGPEYKTWGTRSSVRFGFGMKQRALAIPLTPLFEQFAPQRPPPEPDRRSEGVPPTVPDEHLEWPDENG
ncbi:MAG TPA: hypothetical protein VFW13_15555, partial [Phenylobacterium sp.]|nr:hypothetical protein [Phenylobacterium sp.]